MATVGRGGAAGSAVATAEKVPGASTRSATTYETCVYLVPRTERRLRLTRDPSPGTATRPRSPSLSPRTVANAEPEASSSPPPPPRAAAGSARATAGGAAGPGAPAAPAARGAFPTRSPTTAATVASPAEEDAARAELRAAAGAEEAAAAAEAT